MIRPRPTSTLSASRLVDRASPSIFWLCSSLSVRRVCGISASASVYPSFHHRSSSCPLSSGWLPLPPVVCRPSRTGAHLVEAGIRFWPPVRRAGGGAVILSIASGDSAVKSLGSAPEYGPGSVWKGSGVSISSVHAPASPASIHHHRHPCPISSSRCPAVVRVSAGKPSPLCPVAGSVACRGRTVPRACELRIALLPLPGSCLDKLLLSVIRYVYIILYGMTLHLFCCHLSLPLSDPDSG